MPIVKYPVIWNGSPKNPKKKVKGGLTPGEILRCKKCLCVIKYMYTLYNFNSHNQRGKGGFKGGKNKIERSHKSLTQKSLSLPSICIIIAVLLLTLPSVSAIEMTHRVQVLDHEDLIVVYVTTSQVAEITLERFEPLKVADGDIRYTKANYKVTGLNCVVGRQATFRLLPTSRSEDVVIPITLRHSNQSRTFTYTILADAVAPTPAVPAVAMPPAAPEPAPTAQPDNDLLMLVLGATAVLAMVIIGFSVVQKKRPVHREK